MLDLLALNKLSTWYYVLVAFTTVLTFLTIGSVWWVTRSARRRVVPPGSYVPISVLKPLCGVDDNLEQNLESFFKLTYPDYELVFGVAGDEDPAIAVVQKLRKLHPQVRVRLITHDGQRGLNPKVANLRAMLERGAHDVVVISDSNVSVQPDYLDEMYAQLLDEGVEMVTSLIVGAGEESLGATLENLHLSGYVAGISAGAQITNLQFVIGKSVMYRRSVLDRLGGMESLSNVLGEDNVMGKMIQLAGYEVRVCTQAVRNVCVHTSFTRFVNRHMRWGLIRTRLTPHIYISEPLSYPAAVALLAPLFDVDMTLPLLWATTLIMLRDGTQLAMLRGTTGLWQVVPFGLLKELVLLAVWLAAPFNNQVTWRGKRYLVGLGTHLYTESPMVAPGEIREVG